MSKYRRWTKEEDDLLIYIYNDKTLKELGKIFNRHWNKVCRRAIRLGIKKSPEAISRELSKSMESKKEYFSKKFSGKGNPNYKRGYRYSNGYKLVLTKNGYKREHRLIYEKENNCCLLKKTVIHHIDSNKLNNNINNLEMKTVSQHMRDHAIKRYGKQSKKRS